MEYDLADISFNTWLKPLEVYEVKNNTVTVVIPAEQGSMGLGDITKRYKIPLQDHNLQRDRPC